MPPIADMHKIIKAAHDLGRITTSLHHATIMLILNAAPQQNDAPVPAKVFGAGDLQRLLVLRDELLGALPALLDFFRERDASLLLGHLDSLDVEINNLQEFDAFPDSFLVVDRIRRLEAELTRLINIEIC